MGRADDADGADANPALCVGESAPRACRRTAAGLVALERLQLGCECPVSLSKAGELGSRSYKMRKYGFMILCRNGVRHEDHG